MLVLPAIDLRGGRCVRLLQGRADRETVFGEDPLRTARMWAEGGAEMLHVVDLDGAFGGKPAHRDVILRMARGLDIPLQVGGGIRDDETAAAYLEGGVERVIIGTRALRDPDGLAALCARYPGRICAGVDAKGGRVAVSGWVEESETAALELAARLGGMGLRAVIYTDISRDGTLEGPNIEATRAFAEACDAPVIASGGIGSLDDVRAVATLPVEGMIIGRALYSGAVPLAEAIAAAR